MPDEQRNVFAGIIDFLKEVVDWVEQNLGDPALAATLRADLGLAPGEDVPAAARNELTSHAAGMDPDKVAFDETVAEITDVVEALIGLGELLKADGATGWDVVYLIARVAAAESLRVRWPVVYAAAKLLAFISDDPETVEDLDPARVMGLLTGSAPPSNGEVFLQRLNHLVWVVLTATEKIVEAVTDTELFDAYYGWDPDPSSPTPLADLVSARAITLMAGGGGDLAARIALTALGVPSEHRGPGLFLSLGGALEVEHTEGDTTYALEVGVTDALDLFIPWGGSPLDFTADGDLNGFLRLDVLRGSDERPALRFGDPGGTRLDVGKLLVGVELGDERAALRAGMQDATLVIVLGEGDGFLAQLPGGEIRVALDLVVTADTEHGVRIEGGTKARATLPLNAGLFGVFTIYHVDIVLGPSLHGRDASIELSGGFGVKLGPFRASVDRLGLLLDIGIGQGNLGLLDVDLGFKPPNGIGLALDAGPVAGGGYLYLDPARGEYAGALELTMFGVGVKAIGILSTRMPDGSEGWSLLLLVYGQFPPIQLSWGFTLTGVGGVIGIQHGVSIDALASGMRTGVLDDILFPADPVGDAPRIINRLRTVFPVTPRALTFGPMVDIGWGTPNIMNIRLGVIVQLDNAIGSGAGSLELSRLVLVGQLLVQLPPKELGAPPLLKLLVDVLGSYDADQQRLGFVARLRDSMVAGLTLTGMLVVQADFGDHPSFVLAAGGFHPRFTDLPPGLPAPIDRLGVSFDISIVHISLTGYFAVTPASVQTGAAVNVKASIGPVSLEGWLSFDAIFFLEPRFHFEADLRAGVRVKFKGHTLASVELTMTLTGPGLWRATGHVSFSILFWDVSKSFDVTVGSAPEALPGATEVAELMIEALTAPGSWAAQLPPAGAAIASIGPVEGIDGVLAHPLGQLQLVQNVAPLDFALERFGETTVEGTSRFDLSRVTLGEQVIEGAALDAVKLSRPFARSQFVTMSEEDKLTRPSFESFTAGVAVGTDAYVPSGSQVAADLSYETHYLEPPRRGRLGLLVKAELGARGIAAGELTWQAGLGAAGRSPARVADRLRPGDRVTVTVREAPLAAATVDAMRPADALAGVAPTGGVVTNTAVAQRAVRGAPGVQVVEAYELIP